MADNIDGWITELERASGIIVGVEIGHPGNHELRVAARPFLDYVNGLGPSAGVEPNPFDISNHSPADKPGEHSPSGSKPPWIDPAHKIVTEDL